MESQNELNIVLIGMMGSGKTYIGGKLAKLLVQFNYVDTDEEIEHSEKTTISEIFKTKGEEYFREKESEIIEKCSQKRNQIISVGGGAVEKTKNLSELRKNGLIFYLKAPAQELFNRISNEQENAETRPLLANNFSVSTIEKILKSRERNYQKADFIIDTNQKQAYTILDDILKEYDHYVKQKSGC